MNDKSGMEKTKALMRSLVNMPPRHHDEMKIGKKKARAKKRPKKPGK